MADVIKPKPDNVIIERTPVGAAHHIWIQTVHEPIYEASYAACIYTEEELRAMVEGSGNTVEKGGAYIAANFN